jgi:O-antigen ligase/tetratricopeptide (TPR) repeat protein
MVKVKSTAPGADSKLQLVILGAICLSLFLVPVYMQKTKMAAEFLWSKGFILNLTAYLALGLYLIRVGLEGKVTLPRTKTLLPLALFIMAIGISLPRAINFPKPMETLIELHGAVIIYLLILLNVNRRRYLDYLAIAASLGMLLVVGYGILQYIGVYPIPKDQYSEVDPSSFIGLSNFVVEYLLVASPFAFALFFMAKEWFTIGLSGILVGLIGWYVIISQNRAGWLGFMCAVVCLLVLVFLRSKKLQIKIPWKWVTVTFASIVIVSTTLMFTTKQGEKYKERLLSYTDFKDATIMFRLETWKSVIHMWKDKPIFGHGLAQVEVLFPAYQTQKVERLIFRNNTRVVRAHNEYVQVLAEQGIIGFLILIFLIVQILRLAIFTFRKRTDVDDWWYVAFLSSGLFGFLIMMGFCFPLHVPSSFLYFFIALAALELMAHFPTEKLKKKDPPPELMTMTLEECYVLTPEKGGWRKIVFWGIYLFAVFFCVVVGVYNISFSYKATKAEVIYKESKVFNRMQRDRKQNSVMAKKLLDEAISYNPNNEAYYFDRAIARLNLGNVDGSIDDLKQCLDFVPNFGLGRLRLGTMYLNTRDFNAAEKQLLLASDLMFSRRNSIEAALADIYTQMKPPRLDDALANINRAIKRVEAKLKHKKSAMKIPKLRKEMRNLEKHLPGYYDVRGQIYAQQKKYALAIKDFERSVELKPKSTVAHVNLSAIFNTLDKPEEALDALGRAMTTEPKKMSKIFYNYARAYCRQNKLELARSYLTKAVAKSPFMMKLSKGDSCLALMPQRTDATEDAR